MILYEEKGRETSKKSARRICCLVCECLIACRHVLGLFEKGKIEPAIDSLQQVIETCPACPTIHEIAGDLMYLADCYEESARHYENALKHMKDVSRIVFKKGIAHAASGHAEDAYYEIVKAASLGSPEARIIVACIEETSGKPPRDYCEH
ncbi:MAG: tetratricopeptide repeat protein [Syntrophales bacterium]